MKVTVRGDVDAVAWVEDFVLRSSAVEFVGSTEFSRERETIFDIDVTQKRRERRTADETQAFRDMVWRLYLDERMSQAEIARRMGCSRAYVSRIISNDY